MFQKTSSCFTNQVFYVRNIPIRCYTINKITIIITTITTIIVIVIIIIIIVIIITIIIKSIIIIIILSSVLHFFDIRSCVSPLYLNSSVFFLTTCFLLFIGFRCKVLLSNISIDLLLLALVFLTSFSTFNKQFSKFIMW